MGLFNVAGYFSVLKWKISVSTINMICFNQNVINLQHTNIFWDHLKKETWDNKKENNSGENWMVKKAQLLATSSGVFATSSSQQSQLVPFKNVGFFPAPDLCMIVSLSSLRLSVVFPTFFLVSSVKSLTITLDPSLLFCRPPVPLASLAVIISYTRDCCYRV